MCVLQVGTPVTISPPALALLLAPGEHTHTHTCAYYPVRVCAHIHRLTENSVVYLSINMCVCVCPRCVCIPGWVGPECSIDYNECVDHHCQNGAQCVDHLDGYSCACPQGFRYRGYWEHWGHKITYLKWPLYWKGLCVYVHTWLSIEIKDSHHVDYRLRTLQP